MAVQQEDCSQLCSKTHILLIALFGRFFSPPLFPRQLELSCEMTLRNGMPNNRILLHEAATTLAL